MTEALEGGWNEWLDWTGLSWICLGGNQSTMSGCTARALGNWKGKAQPLGPAFQDRVVPTYNVMRGRAGGWVPENSIEEFGRKLSCLLHP